MKTVYLMLLHICSINVVHVNHNDVGQMLLSQKCRYAKGIHSHKDFLVLLPNLQNNTSAFEHPFFKKKKDSWLLKDYKKKKKVFWHLYELIGETMEDLANYESPKS